MKKKAKEKRNGVVRNLSRRSLIGFVAISMLLIGVVTALSIQSGKTQNAQLEEKAQTRKSQVTKKGSKNYVTTNEEGKTVVLDRQTGQTRELTPEEAKKLADGIKKLINPSSEGLVEVKLADGTISMDLEGHFQNVMLAKVEEDGTITQTCVDNVDAAAAFFEIDPKLVGSDAPFTKGRRSTTKLEER